MYHMITDHKSNSSDVLLGGTRRMERKLAAAGAAPRAAPRQAGKWLSECRRTLITHSSDSRMVIRLCLVFWVGISGVARPFNLTSRVSRRTRTSAGELQRGERGWLVRAQRLCSTISLRLFCVFGLTWPFHWYRVWGWNGKTFALRLFDCLLYLAVVSATASIR